MNYKGLTLAAVTSLAVHAFALVLLHSNSSSHKLFAPADLSATSVYVVNVPTDHLNLFSNNALATNRHTSQPAQSNLSFNDQKAMLFVDQSHPRSQRSAKSDVVSPTSQNLQSDAGYATDASQQPIATDVALGLVPNGGWVLNTESVVANQIIVINLMLQISATGTLDSYAVISSTAGEEQTRHILMDFSSTTFTPASNAGRNIASTKAVEIQVDNLGLNADQPVK